MPWSPYDPATQRTFDLMLRTWEAAYEAGLEDGARAGRIEGAAALVDDAERIARQSYRLGIARAVVGATDPDGFTDDDLLAVVCDARQARTGNVS
jgi:hypothetical protein